MQLRPLSCNCCYCRTGAAASIFAVDVLLENRGRKEKQLLVAVAAAATLLLLIVAAALLLRQQLLPPVHLQLLLLRIREREAGQGRIEGSKDDRV